VTERVEVTLSSRSDNIRAPRGAGLNTTSGWEGAAPIPATPDPHSHCAARLVTSVRSVTPVTEVTPLVIEVFAVMIIEVLTVVPIAVRAPVTVSVPPVMDRSFHE
jgi:hypothetical protein